MHNSCFLGQKSPYFSQSATIYPSVLVILFDDVVALFRINYSHPEVSYVTKSFSERTLPDSDRSAISHGIVCSPSEQEHHCTIAPTLPPSPPPPPPPFQKCFYWKASGQGHCENSGVTVAPRITMVMPKQCLTAKPNTKFDSQLTLPQLPTPFPLLFS